MNDPITDPEVVRQVKALYNINDEIMSCLHAHQLRDDTIPSDKVRRWLRGLYDMAQVGLGKPVHFAALDRQPESHEDAD